MRLLALKKERDSQCPTTDSSRKTSRRPLNTASTFLTNSKRQEIVTMKKDDVTDGLSQQARPTISLG